MVGPPPPREELDGDLQTVVEILFRPNDEMHQRKNGKLSKHITRLLKMVEKNNGSLLGGDWIHHCWDAAKERPCCRNLAETHDTIIDTTTPCITGTADPIPEESTWTNVVPNFKRTLMREIIYGIGTESLTNTGNDDDDDVKYDEETLLMGDKKLDLSRRRKATREYFEEPDTMPQLTVHTVCIDLFDRNLL